MAATVRRVMLRRFLIRLRFRPVIGRLFDHLLLAMRLGWLAETATLPPEPIYVPPRKIENDSPQRERDA